MAKTSARVETRNASKYLQQLCKHWSHRLQVEFTPERGTVRFGQIEAVCTLNAAPDSLLVTLEGPQASDLGRLEGVVAEHLKRFAFREELVFDWTKAAD